MKSTLQIVLFLLMMCGVFSAETVEPISVMEGDSVTLNLDLTKIQRLYLIQWRFGDKGSIIAQIDGNEISYKDYEIFRDRLQLNQTGSLTITNIRTNHSGLYKAEINHSTGTLNIKFNVSVYDPPVIAGEESEMKSVSVMEGDHVTLHVPQLQGNELIVWGFGDEGKLIAKHDMEAKSSLLYDTDDRFRDRLKLDRQTGSLIITNSRTTDSGTYTVKISSNKQTSYKRFTVTVRGPGLSPGAVAGIVVVLLVAVAAAVGVFYGVFYRRKSSELKNEKSKTSEQQNETSLTEKVQNSEHETPLVYVEFADQEKGALTKEERKSEMEKDERERHIFVEDTAGSQAIGDDDEHP